MRPEQEMAERNNLIERAADLICNDKAGTPKQRSEEAVKLLLQATPTGSTAFMLENAALKAQIQALEARLDTLHKRTVLPFGALSVKCALCYGMWALSRGAELHEDWCPNSSRP